MVSEPSGVAHEPMSSGSSGPSNIARASVAIAVIALGAKILGFGEKVVTAHFFGTGWQVDAAYVALSIPAAVFFLVRELIEPAFLPLFVENLRGGRERRGWQLFTFVGAVILAITGVCVAAAWMWPLGIADAFAPGFDGRSRDLTAELIRLVAPGAIFLSLSSLTYITLNAYRRFVLPALGDLAWKAGPMAGVALLVRPLGITALAVGYLVGAAGRLAVHWVGLARRLPRLSFPEKEARRDLSRLTLLMLPLVLGSGFSMISDLADNFFASMLGEGGVAARSFAKKLKDLPLEVIPYTLSVVLFPYFAHLAADRDQERLYALLGNAARGLGAFFAAVAVCIVLLPEPIVSLALERGAFGVEARERTAWALQMYGLGMITFALETILVNFYFAVQDTVTPVVLGLLGVLVNILLTRLLIEPLGVGGVALAQTISKTLKVGALAVLLQRKRAQPWSAITRSALVVTAGIAVAGVGLTLFRGLWTIPLENMPLVARATLVGSGGLVGTVLCLGTIVLVGRPERQVLWLAATRLGKLLKRWA